MALTTLDIGEESLHEFAAPTTMAIGEEEPKPTTMAVGEEDTGPTTLRLGEEGGDVTYSAAGVADPFGQF